VVNSGIETQEKDKIIGILKVLFPEAKIYLYGSRARGEQQEFSDIDLAIDAGAPIALYDMNEAKSLLAETNIVYNFDLVDMHNIPDALCERINKEAILWSLC